MLPKLRPFLVGAATFVPGVRGLLVSAKEAFGLGGAVSARYCYSVWLRHVVLLAQNGLWKYPKSVAELGPGDSLGVGFCALLSGAESYQAFDVMRFANQSTNFSVFAGLIELFKARAPIPDDREFPEITPRLRSYDFPSGVFSDRHLDMALATDRLARIRESILALGATGNLVRYEPNWNTIRGDQLHSIDLIFSQAVLEHASNLEETYRILLAWLASDGVMSHSIDFRCHNMFTEWNGHWTVPEFIWTIMVGKRVYLLNREPYSRHRELQTRLGFRIIGIDKYKLQTRISHSMLSSRFRDIDPEDITIGMATIQSQQVA